MEKSAIVPTGSNSIEDFSEYADAEESISAPNELLAEFLYSIMTKDYEKAFQYSTQILSYEPENATVKEFRLLIEEKLEKLRNEEHETSSSDSSLSYSSSTSGSSDDLYNLKNGLTYSSSESDDEEVRRSNALQSDFKNVNTETDCSYQTTEDSVKSSFGKEVDTCLTRTIIQAELLAHQTQTRVLRRSSTESGQNSEISNLKNENPSTLLHSTTTKVLTKENSLSPIKDNNSRTLAWFTSLQENIFGNKKRETHRSKTLIQKPIRKSANNNNEKEKKHGER